MLLAGIPFKIRPIKCALANTEIEFTSVLSGLRLRLRYETSGGPRFCRVRLKEPRLSDCACGQTAGWQTGAAMLASEIAGRLAGGFTAKTVAVGYEAHLEACSAGTDDGSEPEPAIAQ